MNDKVGAFLLTLGAAFGTVVGSFTVFIAHKFHGTNFRYFLASALSVSAGVMIFISFADILQESIQSFKEDGKYKDHADKFAFLFYFIGQFIGLFLAYLLQKCNTPATMDMSGDMLETLATRNREAASSILDKNMNNIDVSGVSQTEKDDVIIDVKEVDPTAVNNYVNTVVPPTQDSGINKEDRKHLLAVSIITGVALAVHNFPEGLATFTAAMDSSKMGITLGITMIIHNVPEGMAVAIPTFFATQSKGMAVLVTAISGAAQPIGALFGWLILTDGVSPFVFGVFFGLVAGIMTIISFQELLPNAYKYDVEDKVTTISLMVGMIVVAVIMVFL